MGGIKDLLYASFVRCILLFSREGAEDRLYATDRSGVGPEEGFFHKLSRQMRQRDMVGMGSLGVGVCRVGRQNTGLFNAARKLNARSVIGTPYIKLIIINCLSTRQKDTLYHIHLIFSIQPISSLSSCLPLSSRLGVNLHKAEAGCC